MSFLKRADYNLDEFRPAIVSQRGQLPDYVTATKDGHISRFGSGTPTATPVFAVVLFLGDGKISAKAQVPMPNEMATIRINAALKNVGGMRKSVFFSGVQVTLGGESANLNIRLEFINDSFNLVDSKGYS